MDCRKAAAEKSGVAVEMTDSGLGDRPTDRASEPDLDFADAMS